MADTNDTIDGLLAEMRDEAAKADMEQDYSVDDAAEMMREFAWRFEAAIKRERGDAAKLREALEHIVNERGILDFCHNNLGSKTWEDWNKVYMTLRKWIDEAMSALSAPPRNCDLPKVAEDPWRAWLDDKSNWDEFGSPKLEIHDWLLAPATEKEGGAK